MKVDILLKIYNSSEIIMHKINSSQNVPDIHISIL